MNRNLTDLKNFFLYLDNKLAVLALWVSISYEMPSLRDVKNYGRQLNSGALRLHITADCARHIDASIRDSFWKKNQAQSSVVLLQITADCARRTLFQFQQLLI